MNGLYPTKIEDLFDVFDIWKRIKTSRAINLNPDDRYNSSKRSVESWLVRDPLLLFDEY